MANIRLNNILLEKLIENEVNAALPNIPESEKEILRQELRTRYNLYKSYTKVIPNFWKKYGEYLKTKQWRELRETVFKRDGYKCLLCGEKANTCHHLSYGVFYKIRRF
jgi:hypothetical protein